MKVRQTPNFNLNSEPLTTMACFIRHKPTIPSVRVLTILFLHLHATSTQFVNDNFDERYLDPNQYIGKTNSFVQDRLRADLSRDRGQARFSTGRPDLASAAQTFDVGADVSRDYDEVPSRPRGGVRRPIPSRTADVDYQDVNSRSFPDRTGFSRAFSPQSAVFNNQLNPRISPREVEIERILAQIDEAATEQCAANVHAQWDFETNVNEATQLRAVSVCFIYLPEVSLRKLLEKLILSFFNLGCM